MGGEGAEGVGRGDKGLGAERRETWRLGRTNIREEGGGRGDGKQRRKERREKATKWEIDLAFHS
jgi:hypothetical protein